MLMPEFNIGVGAMPRTQAVEPVVHVRFGGLRLEGLGL
jgi:hypothetical protein